jgi:two-component system response regulator
MILLVEDKQEDTALIRRELEKHLPADCIQHAVDGAEAINFIKHRNSTPLQLILVDLHLSDQSGLEVLKRLREIDSTRHVPVVMMSNTGDHDDVAKSYDLGANSVISKTSPVSSFTETVSQLVPYWLQLNHPYIRPGAKR